MGQTFPIALHCHSQTHKLHFKGSSSTRPYTLCEFLHAVHQREFTGVTLDTQGDNFGHLGGHNSEHFARLKAKSQQLSLKLELETVGTRLDRLSQMLDICNAVGADTLITRLEYTQGESREQFRRALRDLRTVTPYLDGLGIELIIANDPQHNSEFLHRLIHEAHHPRLGLQFDPLSAALRGEDPLQASATLMAHTRRSLISDYVLSKNEQGRFFLQSTTLGSGLFNLNRLREQQFNAGVKRFCFAPQQAHSVALPTAVAQQLLAQYIAKSQPSTSDTPSSPTAVHLAMFNESIGFDASLQWYKQQLAAQHYIVLPEKAKRASLQLH